MQHSVRDMYVVYLASENASGIKRNLEGAVKSASTSFLEIVSTVQFVDLMDPKSIGQPEEQCLLDTFLTDSATSGSTEQIAMDLEKCFRTVEDQTSYHILLFPATRHIIISPWSPRTGVSYRYCQGKPTHGTWPQQLDADSYAISRFITPGESSPVFSRRFSQRCFPRSTIK